MMLGIDFDNTIVSYDGVFNRVAFEKDLIPENLPSSKNAVRNFLRQQGKEKEWTKLQGLVYGANMEFATPFLGVKKIFTFCKEAGVPIRIISHKTRFPYLGEKYDLHETALKWLKHHGFLGSNTYGISKKSIHFELTIEAKIKRIQSSECTCFIDDLPELLLHPIFPKDINKWLFDPFNSHSDINNLLRFSNWENLLKKVQNSLLE